MNFDQYQASAPIPADFFRGCFSFKYNHLINFKTAILQKPEIAQKLRGLAGRLETHKKVVIREFEASGAGILSFTVLGFFFQAVVGEEKSGSKI